MQIYLPQHKLLKRAFAFMLTLIIYSSSHSQSIATASENPITLAAPHLPKMIRYDGVGKEFHGEKHSYKKEVNVTAVKDWIKNHPDEVTKYKEAAAKYFSSVKESELTVEEKELYYDQKSQWYIVRQYVF